MVHDNLRSAGLLLGRNLDLLLELVVAKGDADRPEVVVMVKEDAGRPEMVVVVEGGGDRPQMVVVVEEYAPGPPPASCSAATWTSSSGWLWPRGALTGRRWWSWSSRRPSVRIWSTITSGRPTSCSAATQSMSRQSRSLAGQRTTWPRILTLTLDLFSYLFRHHNNEATDWPADYAPHSHGFHDTSSSVFGRWTRFTSCQRKDHRFAVSRRGCMFASRRCNEQAPGIF